MFTEILGVIIIIGVLFILLLKHNILNREGNAYDDNGPENVGLAAGQLKKELEMTGDKISRQINGQMDQLEALINAADKKIEELKIYNALLAENENKVSLQFDSPQKPPVSADFNSLLKNAAKNEYGGTVDILADDNSRLAADSPNKENNVGNALSKTAELVFSMLDEGLSPQEISRRLSIGRGAVDMIVQMHEKLHSR